MSKSSKEKRKQRRRAYRQTREDEERIEALAYRHVGVAAFLSSHTSAVERAALGIRPESGLRIDEQHTTSATEKHIQEIHSGTTRREDS